MKEVDASSEEANKDEEGSRCYDQTRAERIFREPVLLIITQHTSNDRTSTPWWHLEHESSHFTKDTPSLLHIIVLKSAREHPGD